MTRFVYRTIWLSDTHLGSRSAQAEHLAEFLKHVECDTLYLVGDFIDFWRLRSRPFWPRSHNDVIRRLLKLVKHGTKIVFIPGNHDEAARQYDELEFGGIRIEQEMIHVTADGRKLLVTHGDKYDLVIKNARLLSILGSVGYELLIKLNRPYNSIRALLGLPRASLSKAIKLRVKSACNFISAFEQTLAHEARDRGLQGVVCGHIHKPEIIHGEVTYFNCGDWVESCTALVEYDCGTMQLLHYAEPPGVLPQRPPVDDDEIDASTILRPPSHGGALNV